VRKRKEERMQMNMRRCKGLRVGKKEGKKEREEKTGRT
jgi:hypothetical protein